MEFQTERNVFIRENASGMYGAFSYFSSKFVMELPLLFIFPLLENVIIFWAVGYRSGSFFQFLIVYVLTAQIGNSIGYFISSLFDNVMTAAQVTPFAIMPSVLFAGLIVNLSTLPTWIAWFKWTSPTYFACQALLWAQWPSDEYGIAGILDYNLDYNTCVIYLAAWTVVYKLATLMCLSLLTRSAFK